MSDGQYKLLYSAIWISSSLSLFGSSSIIYLILAGRRTKDLYQRLVLGLSINDLITSTGLLLSPLLSRSDIGLLYAVGNATTCSADAFLNQFVIGSAMYNAFLAVYFLLTVRYRYSNYRAVATLEPYVHIAAFGVPLIFGVVSVAMGLFNPNLLLGVCLFSHFPTGCQYDQTITCLRGQYEDKISWVHVAILMVSSITGFAATWMVYHTVRAQEKRGRQFQFTGTTNETFKKRLNAVMQQAVLYSLAYLVGFLGSMFNGSMRVVYGEKIEDATFLAQQPLFITSLYVCYIFFPLQGFFNMVVFVRPRCMRWKDAYPDRSWLWVLWQVLKLEATPTTLRTSHLVDDEIVNHVESAPVTQTIDPAHDGEKEMENAIIISSV